MPMAERTARARWKGNLAEGRGQLTAESSQVLVGVPVTWAARTKEPAGVTSPEELLAAAHASCLAMALSHALDQKGHAPEALDIAATAALDPTPDGGVKVSTMDIVVRAHVPGLDQGSFEEIAREAEQACPISNAIRGNVDIRLETVLEG